MLTIVRNISVMYWMVEYTFGNGITDMLECGRISGDNNNQAWDVIQ